MEITVNQEEKFEERKIETEKKIQDAMDAINRASILLDTFWMKL